MLHRMCENIFWVNRPTQSAAIRWDFAVGSRNMYLLRRADLALYKDITHPVLMIWAFHCSSTRHQKHGEENYAEISHSNLIFIKFRLLLFHGSPPFSNFQNPSQVSFWETIKKLFLHISLLSVPRRGSLSCNCFQIVNKENMKGPPPFPLPIFALCLTTTRRLLNSESYQ